MRRCYFCGEPIPEDEEAVEAITKNAWAHFVCWYDGPPINRDEPLSVPKLPANRS